MNETNELNAPESTPQQGAKWKGGVPQMNPNQFRQQDPRTKSAFLAAFLSLVPGLGQIYVGYYNRGFIHPIIAGATISLMVYATPENGTPPFYFPLGLIFIIFFWLYNIIDAWRRALMYNLALEGVENIPLPDDMNAPSIGGSKFGGAVLLIVGFIILLRTKFNVPIEYYEQWWPLAPMALGGYLLYRGYLDKNA